MTKAELLRLSNREWQQLVGRVFSLPGEMLERPEFLGEWSVKDMLGHISYWEGVALARLSVILNGGKIQFFEEKEIQRINKEQVEKHRSEPLETIRRNLELAHTDVMRAIDRFPEDKFQSNEQNLHEWLAEDTFNHYAEHRQKLIEALARLDHQ